MPDKDFFMNERRIFHIYSLPPSAEGRLPRDCDMSVDFLSVSFITSNTARIMDRCIKAGRRCCTNPCKQP